MEVNLAKKSAIYVYQYIDDKTKYYIGSAKDISQRFRQHRYRVSRNIKSCPMFYNYVLKYAWDKYRYGILEYCSKDLVNREQFYLDLLKPTLNLNKIAGSMLGFKHSEINRLKFSLARIGKSFKKDINLNREFKPVGVKTRSLLKERCRGAPVIVLDKKNIVVNKFKTIKDTANSYNLSASSISKYLKSGALWQNSYTFSFNLTSGKIHSYTNSINKHQPEIKDKKGHSLVVLGKDKNTLFNFKSVRSASINLGISRESLIKYTATNKIWGNKYYFIRQT